MVVFSVNFGLAFDCHVSESDCSFSLVLLQYTGKKNVICVK